MTLNEWARILAESLPEELHTTMLVCADDLNSETGAQELRDLARKKFRLYHCNANRKDINLASEDWESLENQDACVSPATFAHLSEGFIMDHSGGLNYRRYASAQIAWADLLQALEDL